VSGLPDIGIDAELVALVREAVPDGLALQRTECACPEDVAYCRKNLGHLIGSDIAALEEFPGADQLMAVLQASKGARVELGDRAWRIPTIRPRLEDGRCVFLGEDDRCRIHAVAPFGCAYFDAHMDQGESDARAWWGIAAIVDDPKYLAMHARLRSLGAEVDPLA